MGDMAWRKSSLSGNNNNCVEVAFRDQNVLLRDSKYLRDPANDPQAQPVITIPTPYWPTFLELALGADIHGSTAVPTVTIGTHGITVRDAVGTMLEFTPAEWTAFVAGTRAGEFAAASI